MFAAEANGSASATPPAPETALADTWDLTVLFSDAATWEKARQALAADIPGLKAFKGRLAEGPATLLEALEKQSALHLRYTHLSLYANLLADEDTRVAEGQERAQLASQLGSDLAQASSWLSPEILALGDAAVHAAIAAEPRLAPYRFGLENALRQRPHTLGAEAENVLAALSPLTQAAGNIHGILTNADIPWPTVTLSDGTVARLDASGYTRYRGVTNRDDRKRVFDAFWGTFQTYARTLGTALYNQNLSDVISARARNYPDALGAALSANDVPGEVYTTLVAEVNAALPALHRYFKLRARLLGVEQARYHDIYPPMLGLEKSFTLAEAKRLTIESTRPLGRDYTDWLSEGLNGRWMHAYPKEGKQSGAYMAGYGYTVHPFVLMNFNNDYEGVTTLAHEWGHAMHSRLANATQPFPTADYPIFTAEIASVVNEVLLLEHMLKTARDDDERLYYLGAALEGMRGTFFRQAMFAEFELATHREVESGGALSSEGLTRIYGDLLRRYHGDAEGVLKIDEAYCVEWAYIPHFYSAYYVYQYATSMAAANLFADRILAGEAGAVETYLGVLRAGGSRHPYQLVKAAGVDLATPAPYRSTVLRFSAIMDQIEAILAKRAAPGPVPAK
jgi:oligoendopeptidase F